MLSNHQEYDGLIDKVSNGRHSLLAKYQDLCIGNRSLAFLLRYELLTSLISPIPGALGFFLRQFFYKRLFANTGRGLAIAANISTRCPQQVSLGDNIFLDSGVTLDAIGIRSHITIGNSIFLGKHSLLSCSSSTITLGNHISIGPNCYIRASRGPVTLGSHITIGAHTVIISGGPHYKRLDIPMMNQSGTADGITIGDDVWLGVGVRVIDGVNIGNGSVIGAGAVVTKSIPEYSIAVGVPAKVIQSRKSL